jgi:hypothetical protein
MRRLGLSLAGSVVLFVAAPPAQAVRDEPVTISVEGRSSQTPWAAPLGEFVVVAFGAQTPDGKADVLVAVSRDAGRHFGAPVRVNAVEGEARLGGELPPRVGLVARAGADPEIVVAYGARGEGTEIRLARSLDSGRTFPTPRVLQTPGVPGDRGWHALAIDERGDAHVMWLDHRGLAAAKSTGHHAGHGEGAAARQHEKDAIDGVAMAQRSGLYYARVGANPAGERELVKGVCYCCKVALAATPAGGLYAAWRHVYEGNIRDIAFVASTDGGKTFGAPGRVSDDAWQLAGCPDDGPAMSVDAGGVAHVIWPTVLGGETPEGALFYASSAEGRAFSPRGRIPTLGSPRPMHPQILSLGKDRLIVAWDEVVNGTRQAAVQGLRLDRTGHATFGSIQRLGTPDLPSSYPVLVATPSGPVAVFVEGKPGASVIRVAKVLGP